MGHNIIDGKFRVLDVGAIGSVHAVRFGRQPRTGNVRFGSKADIGLTGGEWLLLTLSGHSGEGVNEHVQPTEATPALAVPGADRQDGQTDQGARLCEVPGVSRAFGCQTVGLRRLLPPYCQPCRDMPELLKESWG